MNFHNCYNNILKLLCILLTSAMLAAPISLSKELPKPKRVVSTFLAADEILVELLGKSLRKRVIALSPLAWNGEYSNIEAKALKRIKPYGDELESLIALKPDLVLSASFNRPELTHMIEVAGIRNATLGNFSSFKDLRENILIIGQLLGEEEDAKRIIATFEARLKSTAENAGKIHYFKKPSVLVYSPENILTGKETIFTDAASAAKTENLAASLGFSGWKPYSLEKLAGLNPDFVICAGETKDKDTILKDMQNRPGWKNIPAVKNAKVILIPPRLLFTASQHAASLVEMLHLAIYGG